MKKLHSIFVEARDACFEITGRVTAQEVIDYARAKYGEEMQELAYQAAQQGYLRIVKHILKQTTKDDGLESGEAAQYDLPGFKAPTSYAVIRENGDFEYVKFEEMTAPDFLCAMRVRREHVERSQKRLQDLRLKWDELRPYMEHSPLITVKEAARLRLQSRQGHNQVFSK